MSFLESSAEDRGVEAEFTGAPAAAPPIDPARRAELVQQFERWLDRMLAAEPPPAGLPQELVLQIADATPVDAPPDGAADLYTLSSAITALTGEVRLQGRTFRQLAESLDPLKVVPERLEYLGQLQQAIAQQVLESITAGRSEESDTAGLPPADDVLQVLFDLRERLERGLRTFEAPQPDPVSVKQAVSWWRRLFGATPPAPATSEKSAAAAMADVYRLTLSRLDAALFQWDIHPFAQVGDPFDPEHMSAVDVQFGAGVADGTVVEVYRGGYRLRGQVLVTAKVKVARAAAADR